MFIYHFINGGVNKINIRLSKEGCSIVINHQNQKYGTVSDVMAEIRRFLEDNASYLTSGKTIQINIDVYDKEGNTSQMSMDRSNIVCHLRRLASSYKCQFDIRSGIDIIS